ncbi:sulfite reduction-associated complex DsrMKJOP protein DsrM [Desulfocucumis palustris]|uniref:Sulfite reduction-associated complex DsrMKJOP protein DsrM n=1 Tax=Desulfocucumis palustris TaxID=1898651 RepID=A0A2L2XAC0_9FIRM|nr:hypothetical protein [Desulfocucumis palustris]GBF33145.1 sulfite reduction-associated complex DsrMKJOP protein DsrM [Desulfocucumis palustris]
MLYFIMQIMPYIALTVFTLGMLYRLGRWAGARIVHNITLSPFPGTKTQAAAVIGSEVIFFRSLFKSDFALWLGAWAMPNAGLSTDLIPNRRRDFPISTFRLPGPPG